MAGTDARGAAVQILVKNPTEPGTPAFELRASRTCSVAELKAEIAAAYPGQPAVESQRLIFSGKLLTNDAMLSAVLAGFDASEPQTFHLVISGPPPAGAASASSAAARARTPPTRHAAVASASSPAPNPSDAPTGLAVGVGSGGGETGASAAAAAPEAREVPAHAQYLPPLGNHAHHPTPPWAYGGGPGMVPAYGYQPPAFPLPPPGAFGGPHYPFPIAGFYPPGAAGPQIPPPADDAGGDGAPRGVPPEGPPGGAFPPPPYAAFNGMDPNYVAHLQAMHMRFMQDLAAAEYMQQGVQGQGRQGPPGYGFGFDREAAEAGAAAAGGGRLNGPGFPDANDVIGGGVGVAAGGGNGPRVRQYVFQLDLNWSLISKLIFLVVLFGQEGSSQRMYGLAGAAALVYMWHTGRLGMLQRIVATVLPTPTQLFEAVVPPAPPTGPNGATGDDRRRNINRFAVTFSYAYSFVYGLVCSLLPSWEPVQLPNVNEIFNNADNGNDPGHQAPPPVDAAAGADGDRPHAD